LPKLKVFIVKELNMDEINTLQNAADSLGINYMAIWHMSEFGVVNETEITEDLKNGLLFEWLTFIDRYTDSNINNLEEAVMKLFIDQLSDEVSINLPPEELQLMIDDQKYAGNIEVLNFDEKERVTSTITIRLNLTQYIDLLELAV
jgi:hypothetical protein